MAYKLPDLTYDYNALEPHIDARTMRIHHDKHHAGYVSNLNKALEGYDNLLSKDVRDLLREIESVPQEIKQTVINNGGGHANHSLFWEIMSPNGGGRPNAELLNKINSTFGGFERFQDKFTQTALTRFGSGWAWLAANNGELEVYSTPNQESPLIKGHVPLLALDVWEHAYYLKYQNRRAEYVKAWWNVVNWPAVSDRFSLA